MSEGSNETIVKGRKEGFVQFDSKACEPYHHYDDLPAFQSYNCYPHPHLHCQRMEHSTVHISPSMFTIQCTAVQHCDVAASTIIMNTVRRQHNHHHHLCYYIAAIISSPLLVKCYDAIIL